MVRESRFSLPTGPYARYHRTSLASTYDRSGTFPLITIDSLMGGIEG